MSTAGGGARGFWQPSGRLLFVSRHHLLGLPPATYFTQPPAIQ